MLDRPVKLPVSYIDSRLTEVVDPALPAGLIDRILKAALMHAPPVHVNLDAARMSEISDTLSSRTRIQLREFIGLGATGLVFIGEHETLKSLRAVKIIDFTDRQDKSSFIPYLEASIANMAALHHEHALKIYDAEVLDDLAFYVMDLVNPGRNLRIVSSLPRALSLSGRLRLLEQVINVIAYSHELPRVDLPLYGNPLGFVHGDIKAENVLVRADGSAVVSDWLVPHLAQADFGMRGAGRHYPAFPWFDTRRFGTPMYMAPEQRSEGRLTAASDVWAIGVLIFETLTGFYPFDSERNLRSGQCLLLRDFSPEVPSWVQEVVEGCLRTDEFERPRTGGELEELWYTLSARSVARKASAVPDSIVRVFLSSTLIELQRERESITDALRRLDGVEVVALERLGADPRSAVDRSIEAVRAADLVVLLVADSYGSVDGATGLSVTETEYEAAKSEDIPILAYVRVPSALPRHYGDSVLRPDSLQDEKVRRLIARLEGVFSTFSSPPDLAIQVLADVSSMLRKASWSPG